MSAETWASIAVAEPVETAGVLVATIPPEVDTDSPDCIVAVASIDEEPLAVAVSSDLIVPKPVVEPADL